MNKRIASYQLTVVHQLQARRGRRGMSICWIWRRAMWSEWLGGLAWLSRIPWCVEKWIHCWVSKAQICSNDTSTRTGDVFFNFSPIVWGKESTESKPQQLCSFSSMNHQGIKALCSATLLQFLSLLSNSVAVSPCFSLLFFRQVSQVGRGGYPYRAAVYQARTKSLACCWDGFTSTNFGYGHVPARHICLIDHHDQPFDHH